VIRHVSSSIRFNAMKHLHGGLLQVQKPIIALKSNTNRKHMLTRNKRNAVAIAPLQEQVQAEVQDTSDESSHTGGPATGRSTRRFVCPLAVLYLPLGPATGSGWGSV